MNRFLLYFLLVRLATLVQAADSHPAPLPRSTPEAEGISSTALAEFVAALEPAGAQSVMIVRHGHVVAEGWWAPYSASEPHAMHSLSKSFTSTAVGLAQAEGKLSIEDPVLKFFPELAPTNPSANLKAMRIRDLLRMSSGHHEDDIDPFPFDSKEDLVKIFLSKPVTDRPGTHFLYNTAGTFVLSAIVQKVTGQTVLDYLRPRLFDPLGIVDPTWEASAQGISFGGFGLELRTEDIARFGQLLLQKGEWQGHRLVPAAWIEAATSLQTASGGEPQSDWDQGYGYQFWMCRHGFYRADGANGQFCIVMPQYDTVVAITGGTDNMGGIMNVVWDRLLPELRPAPLPAAADAQARLATRLGSLSLPMPTGKAISPMAAKIAGRNFVFGANEIGLESISLQPTANGTWLVKGKVHGADQQIPAGFGTWSKGSIEIKPFPPLLTTTVGAWTDDDTYTCKICAYRTELVATIRLRFVGDDVALDFEPNIPGPPKITGLAGHSK